jgi:hypothetical protein
MQIPDGNISAAHLSVLYSQLIRQHDSLLLWRLEITVHCLTLMISFAMIHGRVEFGGFCSSIESYFSDDIETPVIIELVP